MLLSSGLKGGGSRAVPVPWLESVLYWTALGVSLWHDCASLMAFTQSPPSCWRGELDWLDLLCL